MGEQLPAREPALRPRGRRADAGRRIICPKHGSLFDACTGDCDNGEAAGTTLPAVEIAVEDGEVYLTDDDYEPLHDGPAESNDAPGSTFHLSL